MGDAHDHLERGGHRQVHQVVLVRGVVPRSRSQSNQTSGGSRRCRQLPAAPDTGPSTVKTDAPGRLLGCEGGHAARLDARRQAWARRASSRVGRGAQARRAAEDRQRRRNPHGIRQPPPMQGRPKDAVVAELGIGQHPAELEAAGAHLAEQRQRLPPLLLKRHVRRHAGPLPRRRCQPRRRQVEGRAEQIRARFGPKGHRHGDLTVGDLAQRAAVLARDPDNARLASSSRRRWRSGITARSRRQTHAASHVDEVLRLIRDPSRARASPPSTSARCRWQPLYVAPQREHLRPVAEALLEHFEPRHQPTQLRDRLTVGHRRTAYRNRAICTMSSNQITFGK